MEITRRSVLLDALEREEAELARCSRDGKKLIPMPGLTEMFERQRQKCELLRDMIHALESEPVRRVMADWQKDVMDGKRVEVTLLDRVPPIDEGMVLK